MKATIDVPEELYRQVKARSASEGRTVREITIRLYEDWLHSTHDAPPGNQVEELQATYAAADRAFKKPAHKRLATDHLRDDRNRLERP